VSAFGDAIKALKDVVLMQERIRVLQEDVATLTASVDGLNDYALSIDKRVVRIETMIEMTTGRSAPPPTIEGN
jgi:hypothetical protein